jgi:hypothetical protein
LGKTNVCRSLDPTAKQCGTVVGTVEPPADFAEKNKSSAHKVTAKFVDALPTALEREHPTGFATYAVEVMNADGRSAGLSNPVHVPLVPTLVPFARFAAEVTAAGVKISWVCPPISGRTAGVKYLFRIYRHLEDNKVEAKIADVEATDCAVGPEGLVKLSAASPASESTVPGSANVQSEPVTSFLDQTFEWEKTYFYRGTVVSVVEMAGKPPVEVEGDDTPEVKIFTHDIFPPAVPTGLQAVVSGPGQQLFIDLIWTPVMDADLAGYNIYRHEEGGAAVKMNSELVKTPAYRDTQVAIGKKYFYSVTAVDQRGNESARSAETSESSGDL